MSALAPTLQAFFTDRLIRERHASPQTVAAYRDTWRLLLGFGTKRTGKPPSALDLDDIDVPLVCALSSFGAMEPRGFRHKGASWFSAYWSHCVFGVMEPADFRHIGASSG